MEQVQNNGGFDSFADTTPIIPNEGGAESQVESSGLDTFEDSTPILPEENQEDSSGEEQKQAEEGKDSQEPEIKRETDKLEEQEKEDKESEPEAKSKDDGKEGADKSSEKTESDKQEDSGAKPKGKTLRLKDGDESVDISPDATIPVKVKGKKEFVSLSELQKNYSGNKAWSEEIASAKQQQLEVKQEREEFERQRETTRAEFSKIGRMIEDAYNNPEADPLSFAKHLIDLSGRDALQFEKRLMDHYGNLAMSFNQMSEDQQDLYWAKRENEIFRDNQASRQKEVEERTATEQREQKLTEVREKYGITEEDYSATSKELANLGYDLEQVTPDQISKYAALKPHVEKSEELCSAFEEDLSDSDMDALVTRTADMLYNYKDIDPLDALKSSAKSLGFEITHEQEAERELEAKQATPQRKDSREREAEMKVASNDSGFESFDDFDELYYR
jgi:hypothetical protein